MLRTFKETLSYMKHQSGLTLAGALKASGGDIETVYTTSLERVEADETKA